MASGSRLLLGQREAQKQLRLRAWGAQSRPLTSCSVPAHSGAASEPVLGPAKGWPEKHSPPKGPAGPRAPTSPPGLDSPWVTSSLTVVPKSPPALHAALSPETCLILHLRLGSWPLPAPTEPQKRPRTPNPWLQLFLKPPQAALCLCLSQGPSSQYPASPCLQVPPEQLLSTCIYTCSCPLT